MRPAHVRDEVWPPLEAAPAPEPALAGTVLDVRSGESLVSLEGRLLRAVLPPAARVSGGGLRSPVAVGDRVAIEPVERGLVRIVSVLPRRSALVRDVYDPSRRDPQTQGQVLAANIDQVVIVCSPAEPPFRPRLLDRYLVAASRDGIRPVICLNKTDLVAERQVEAWLASYERHLGIVVLRTSAATSAGVDGLRACLAGKVSLLAGHSGVGKSSLLNAVEPGLHLRVGDVTRAKAGQGKGRHTTSSARLVPLSESDTFVVDSPGIRAFGIRGIPPRELAQHFPDLAAHAAGCAFADCLHRGEQACAVEVAARGDWFLLERLRSYRAMLGELG
jgi:ribosome biogenesis GTPase